jgi:hypothetical protein
MVIEKAGKNFSAYSPDLSGCVATGKTREETEERMHEAIEVHLRERISCKRSDIAVRSSAIPDTCHVSGPVTGQVN